MVEVNVAHLGVERTTNTPIVVLQEKGGARVIPIYIGHAEANAIAMELADVKFERPLTHDLLRQVIVGLGAELSRVVVTRVEKSTYYAELELRRDDHVIQIDARPSDSIAIALRLKAPIFTSEDLLEAASDDTRALPVLLAEHLPRRFAQAWCDRHGSNLALDRLSERQRRQIAQRLTAWPLWPDATEGFEKAEVMVGGVDTRELSSKTMEARKAPGLYVIGECKDCKHYLPPSERQISGFCTSIMHRMDVDFDFGCIHFEAKE